SRSVRTRGLTARWTLPPLPPSPPSGPPRGTYFSRRKLTQPAPPRPLITWIRAKSTSIALTLRPERCGMAQEPAALRDRDRVRVEVVAHVALGPVREVAHPQRAAGPEAVGQRGELELVAGGEPVEVRRAREHQRQGAGLQQPAAEAGIERARDHGA